MFLNIGFGNVVSTSKVISIVAPDSAPIKRLVDQGREKGRIIDATYGRRTRSVLVVGEYVVLSAIEPQTLAKRTERDFISTQLSEPELPLQKQLS